MQPWTCWICAHLNAEDAPDGSPREILGRLEEPRGVGEVSLHEGDPRRHLHKPLGGGGARVPRDGEDLEVGPRPHEMRDHGAALLAGRAANQESSRHGRLASSNMLE